MIDEHLRVGNNERTQAAARLQQLQASGALPPTEAQRRIQLAWAARTRGDLQPLMEDLPASAPLSATPTPGGSQAPDIAKTKQAGRWGGIVIKLAGVAAVAWIWFVSSKMGASRGMGVNLLGSMIGCFVFIAMLKVRKGGFRLRRKPDYGPLNAAQRDEVLALLKSGRSYDAVDLYRRYSGADLRTATTAIESWRNELS